MSLSAGSRLGPYEIVGALGAGAMGDVYRALDTRLDRTVAIKVLPPRIGQDPVARARFEREARAIAALSHPNICTLHDVGHQDGVEFLVMELLDGETLAQRLARGPLPVADALGFATEIAGALARAHQAGIVHRDLKPANVMLVKGDAGTLRAKLLDFGIAAAAPPTGLNPKAPAAATATSAAALTAEGSIVGTLLYMAPEQLEGAPADARSDLFAFGAVLYEMIAGSPAFARDTRARVMSAILQDMPAPLSDVAGVSPAVSRLVMKCLAKPPDARWQTAADLADELRWISAGANTAVPAPPSAAAAVSRRPSIVPWVIAGFAIAAALWATLTRPPDARPAAGAPARFTVSPPAGGRFAYWDMHFSLALSPDGRHLAYTASSGGAAQLWVRALDSTEPRRIPASEGAGAPFWSPDSRYIGFSTNGKLKKAALDGTPPQVLCDSHFVNGTWSEDGTILLGGSGGIARLPATGGTPVELFKTGLGSMGWPWFLPGGKHFLYVRVTEPGSGDLFVAPLDGTEGKRLMAAASRVIYAPPGYLLFVRERALMAQRFDADRLELVGDPVPVASDTHYYNPTLNAELAASREGSVASPTRLFQAANLRDFDVSPDGSRILVSRVTSSEAQAPAVVVLNWTAGLQK
jgi:hypothetical protein